jgi:uncharacterized membrane protein YadS
MLTIQKKAPGVILCAILAVPAWFLGQAFPLVGAPVFAILLGMFVGSFYQKRDKTAKGIAFTSKYILQTAVVLLGFGLNLMQVVKVGVQSLPIIISTIATSLIVAFCLQKFFPEIKEKRRPKRTSQRGSTFIYLRQKRVVNLKSAIS